MECGALSYPGNGAHLVSTGRWRDYESIAIFTHTGCGPNVGYPIQATQLSTAAAVDHFRKHVRDKVWWWLRGSMTRSPKRIARSVQT